MPERPALKPILVILHQERSSPGRVGQILTEKGFPLDIRRPVLGDPLPKTLADHAGAVIFGGPMSANDPEDYVRREIDWIEIPLKENKPYLGICLGAQMLVKTLGGTVAPHVEGLTEIGWYPLAPTPAGTALMDWPDMVYHFHREGFDLPQGAELLATGETYPNQAFRIGGNAWGIQFHGELTRAMMHRWVVHGAHRFDLPNAQVGRQHLDGRFLYDAALRRWMEGFLELVFLREAESMLKPQSLQRQKAQFSAVGG
ncbi:GMP synthase (glutamine-hydrolysing) [Rhizobium sp. RU20A]|uniref:glutamine amidotransferase n=1 Tax=Rhizobium sp. RU20A TaxID=1907412 RepID=UPI000955D149|nr:glutamine amidotransferase [Rhizobium sp. RU20A]SIQ90100.1 GMP synthase (glutamine-hydrolysing) [Rhizobium sp. RU20A]